MLSRTQKYRKQMATHSPKPRCSKQALLPTCLESSNSEAFGYICAALLLKHIYLTAQILDYLRLGDVTMHPNG